MLFYYLVSGVLALQTLYINQNYIDSDELQELDESEYSIVQQVSNATVYFSVTTNDMDKNTYIEQEFLNNRLFFTYPVDGSVGLALTATKNNFTYIKGSSMYADYWDQNGYYLGKNYQEIFIPAYALRSGDKVYITNLILRDNQTYQYILKMTRTYSTKCPDDCHVTQNYGFCDEVEGICGCDANYIDLDCSKRAQAIMINNRLTHQFVTGTQYFYFEMLSQLDTIVLEAGVENILSAQYDEIQVYVMFENFEVGVATQRANNLSFSFSSDQKTRSYIIDMGKLSQINNLYRYGRLLITVTSSNTCEIYFDISTPSTDSGVNTNLMLIYFLVSLAVVLLLTWIIITIIRYRQARNRVYDEDTLRQQQQQHQRRHQKPGMTQQIIDQYMPKIFFKNIHKTPKFTEKGLTAAQIEACSVCLLEYEKESICRFTPCLHIFHSDCLQQWVLKHENCPLCRTELNEKALEKFEHEEKEHKQPEKQLLKNDGRQQQGLQVIRGS